MSYKEVQVPRAEKHKIKFIPLNDEIVLAYQENSLVIIPGVIDPCGCGISYDPIKEMFKFRVKPKRFGPRNAEFSELTDFVSKMSEGLHPLLWAAFNIPHEDLKEDAKKVQDYITSLEGRFKECGLEGTLKFW